MLKNLTTETKVLGSIFVLTVLILIGGIFFLSKSQGSQSKTSNEVASIDYSKGQKVGSDSAKVKLVEFGDYQCPSCAAADPTIKEMIANKYPDFQFVFRYFPLPQHKNAIPAANLAQFAAQNGKFWEVNSRLFETQAQWQDLGDPTDYFGTLAKDLGLDEAGAKDAVKNRKFQDVIQADINEGENIGVDSTPTFYLDGHKLDLQNFSDLKSQVEQALKK